eukprot:COSAG02_NODE_12689_length_1509_cov_1.573759_1_plen_76_part_10
MQPIFNAVPAHVLYYSYTIFYEYTLPDTYVSEPSGLPLFRRQSNFLVAASSSTLRTNFSVRIQDAETGARTQPGPV